jgi:hypothetical protein
MLHITVLHMTGLADCKENPEAEGPSQCTHVLQQVNSMQHHEGQPGWTPDGPEEQDEASYAREEPAAAMAW